MKGLVHFEIQAGQRNAGCGAEIYPPWNAARRANKILPVARLPEKVSCKGCLEFMISKKKKELKRIEDQLFLRGGI